MTKSSSSASGRPPNPGCSNCNHPKSFHRRNQQSHRSPCGAFGCHCKNFTKAKGDS